MQHTSQGIPTPATSTTNPSRLPPLVTSTLTLSLVALLNGCVASELDNESIDESIDETLASKEQLASWAGFASWSNEGLGGDYSTPIASDSGISCFLAGVGGNLSHDYRYTSPWAGVFRSNGQYEIQARPGNVGAKVATRALCLNNANGRTARVQWTGGNSKIIAPSGGSRRCFLSAVQSLHTNYLDLDWSNSNDMVRVWDDGVNWRIGGAGNARGEAFCIDVQADVGNEYYWHGTTGDLAYNDQNPGTQCFLTGVRGRFRTNSFAEADGVFISYHSGLNRFRMTVDGGKGGWARCIK